MYGNGQAVFVSEQTRAKSHEFGQMRVEGAER